MLSEYNNSNLYYTTKVLNKTFVRASTSNIKKP